MRKPKQEKSKMPPWNNLPDAARALVTFAASLAIVANHYVLEMVSRVY